MTFRTLNTGALMVMLVFAAMLTSCSGSKSGERTMPVSDKISADEWTVISQKSILFGHQSVGKNLIDGINDLVGENQAAHLNIVDAGTLDGKSGPVFAHFPAGANTNPDSKIASFAEHLATNGRFINIAFLKLCYVDADVNTDVEGLFARYRKTLDELKQRFPDVVFIHVTMPLTSLDIGLRRFVNGIRGKSNGEEVNAVRTRYNNLLRKEYAGREPLFDIASVESTALDGSRLQGQKNGLAYEALSPQYTYDGGHLNELGRRRCASVLLKTLANADKFVKAASKK